MSRFQTFDTPSETARSAGRIAALRSVLAEAGLTGFLLPHADAWQNETPPPSEARLAWATGFTGSAGSAVILKDRAALFVDGRYTLQAVQQSDPAVFEVVGTAETPVETWIEKTLSPEDRIGYDPRLFTIGGLRRLEKVAAKTGATLVPLDENPIDRIWDDRPSEPLAPVALHPEALAGEGVEAKLKRVGGALEKDGVDALVLTDPAAVAWTFNIRGGDVAHAPLPLSHAILRREGRPTLVIDGRKLSNEIRDTLAGTAEIVEPGAFEAELAGLSGRKVRLDPRQASAFIGDRLKAGGAILDEGSDPTALFKARKNEAEIEGARQAQLRDGVAVSRFLAWLDAEGPSGRLDEITAVEKLEAFRAETGRLRDISFATIAGAGPNGALPHYRVSRESNRRIAPDTLFLVDSGGQYDDGTTDITRTVAIGTPSTEMQRHYTLVLKGHIAVATARFPKKTTGARLDAFARAALWKAGLDFDHGTGHGIGSYLSVHEGPQRISPLGHVEIEPGMIISNEPGYYREGAYGIRIENLVLVHPPQAIAGGEREMLGFETLTLAPFDRRLIVPDLLLDEERAWVDLYHQRVRAMIEGSLNAEERAWMKAATAPL